VSSGLNSQKSPLRPHIRKSNDGKSRELPSHASESASTDCLSHSVINNRVSQQPPDRGASRREELRFRPSLPSLLLSDADQAPKTKGRKATTAEQWALTHHIAEWLRPTVDDLETGKRQRGPAVCGCGLAANTSPEVTLHLRHRASGRLQAGVSGIYRCDSAWLCPKCAPRVAFERQERVRKVVEATVLQGGTFVAVVLTIRHDRHQSLSELKHAVLTASSDARAGRAWTEIRKRMKAIGVLVAPEVTYNSRHGWHFHLHLGVLCLSQDRTEIEAACRELIARYMALCHAAGYRADWPAQHVCFPDDSISSGEYMGKGAIWEIAGSGTKTSARRHDSFTPFQLAAAAAAGDAQMKKLFLEYAKVMPGTRSCIVTAAMREALHLDKDTDHPGPHDLDEKDNIVGTFPSGQWNILTRNNVACRVLGRLELEGSVAWPQIKAWALSETTSATKTVLGEIPFNGPTTTLVPPPPPDPALDIADRSRRFFGGRKIIEEDLARLTREYETFSGAPPPSIGAVAAALVRRPYHYKS
jgi:hypothetical protein